MSTKDIRTYNTHSVCDVCGRTLLRGEHADVYINGGARRSVCELCKTRALHEGWVREGTIEAYSGSNPSPARRRSLLGRLRSRRTTPGTAGPPATLDAELEDASWALELSQPAPDSPPPLQLDGRGKSREPRHVRAVPTSEDHKMASAVEAFNRSEHRRTIAGVARSLGAAAVAIVPDPNHPTVVRIVVSWELCWYRYEIDLADDLPSVRIDGQGYELTELSDRERVPNAAADDVGQLRLG
jgi:hypothetical protein